MRICETCGAEVERNVCKLCGSAVYYSDRAIVRITATNYNLAQVPEQSKKWMAPFIDGTIRRMTEAKRP